MARRRLEILAEEEEYAAESQAERDRFQELADQYRQQGHLPPGGDQSWRDREAMRRAVYDQGHTPPQSDQARREREAMLFAPSDENNNAAPFDYGNLEGEKPVLRPAPAARNGQGGTILIFILAAAIAFGIAALAYPEMLTAAYWRTPAAQNNPAAPRPAEPPTSLAAGPAAMPSEQLPLASAPALDLKRVPTEPSTQEAPSPVPVIDARPQAGPAPRPASGSRASARGNRDAGGFYAKAPGPDGVIRDTYFPADPKMDSHTPMREAPAQSDTDGFYAKVPGPDGGLETKFFPSKPPPR